MAKAAKKKLLQVQNVAEQLVARTSPCPPTRPSWNAVILSSSFPVFSTPTPHARSVMKWVD